VHVADAAAEKDPAGQGTMAALSLLGINPAGAGRHMVAPGLGEKYPKGQEEQIAITASRNVPGGHC